MTIDTQTLLLISPIIVLQLALQLYALYDIWKNNGAKNNTPIWIVIVIAFQFLGALAYFMVGRKDI